MIDQSFLPGQLLNLTLTDEQQVAEATTTWKVRGAPALGVTAAFGMAFALCRLLRKQDEAQTLLQVQEHLHTVGEMLERTRPTAVNLQWAIDRMLRRVDHAVSEHCSLPSLAQILKDEA